MHRNRLEVRYEQVNLHGQCSYDGCETWEVFEKMKPYFMENYSNPSSVYSFAGEAKKAVDDARDIIAGALNAKAAEIYFTGGGSEADNWAIKATAEAYKNKEKHIITSAIEHHAVLHTCGWLERHGYEVTYLPVDEKWNRLTGEGRRSNPSGHDFDLHYVCKQRDRNH